MNLHLTDQTRKGSLLLNRLHVLQKYQIEHLILVYNNCSAVSFWKLSAYLPCPTDFDISRWQSLLYVSQSSSRISKICWRSMLSHGFNTLEQNYVIMTAFQYLHGNTTRVQHGAFIYCEGLQLSGVDVFLVCHQADSESMSLWLVSCHLHVEKFRVQASSLFYDVA